jgi:translation initiation factor 2 beta subunit (eIF-2beta)/eIF-5
MSIIRTFDINRPHTSIDLLSGGIIGGSLSSGYVSVGDILEIRPGILTITKGKWFSRPFFTIVKSIHTEKNQFDTAFPGGLIAIGTTLDPGYCKSDKLVGQIVSRPGHHHDMFSKLELKMTTIRRPNDTSKISSKYAENEKIMICINSDSIPATILRYNEKTKTALVKLDRPTILNKDTIVSVMKRITGTFKLFSVADILSLEDKVEVIYDEDLPSLEPIKEFEIIDDIGHSPKETSWDYASFWDDSLKQVKIHKAIIPFPSLAPENKNTKWANYNELLSLIAKSQDLVFNDKLPKSCDSASLITPSVLKAMITNFVEKEMSTEIHPNEDGEAIIKGRFKPNDIHHVLGTWVTKYQNCPVCSSCYSYLFREDRILFKSCLDCLSKTAIP